MVLPMIKWTTARVSRRRGFLSCLLSFAPCLLQGGGAEVKGRVWAEPGNGASPTRGLDHIDVELAQVEVKALFTARTSEGGKFSFRDLPPGIYRLTAASEGGTTAVVFPVTIGGGRAWPPPHIPVVMAPARSWKGFLKGEPFSGFAPIVGIVVHAMRLVSGSRICFTDRHNVEKCATTDDVGRSEMGLVGGNRTAKVYVDGPFLNPRLLGGPLPH